MVKHRSWWRLLAGIVLVGLGGFAIVYFAFPGLLLDAYRAWQRSEAGFERRTVEVEGWTIPYLDSAPDGEQPVVLLLHGFGDTKDHFVDFAAGLTGRYRVLAPDLPGFGETAFRPGAEYTSDLYITTVLHFLDNLGISKVHLVGYSMGGMVAVKVAARSPRRVHSLTLLAPAGLRGDRPSELDRMIESGLESPLIYRDRKAFERMLCLNFNRLPAVPGFAMRAIFAEGKRRAPVFERIFEAMLADPETPTFRQEIASLTMPVLLIIGREDRIVDASVADRWQELHPEIETVILPDTSHGLVHQRPQAISDRLLEHLDR